MKLDSRAPVPWTWTLPLEVQSPRQRDAAADAPRHASHTAPSEHEATKKDDAPFEVPPAAAGEGEATAARRNAPDAPRSEREAAAAVAMQLVRSSTAQEGAASGTGAALAQTFSPQPGSRGRGPSPPSSASRRQPRPNAPQHLQAAVGPFPGACALHVELGSPCPSRKRRADSLQAPTAQDGLPERSPRCGRAAARTAAGCPGPSESERPAERPPAREDGGETSACSEARPAVSPSGAPPEAASGLGSSSTASSAAPGAACTPEAAAGHRGRDAQEGLAASGLAQDVREHLHVGLHCSPPLLPAGAAAPRARIRPADACGSGGPDGTGAMVADASPDMEARLALPPAKAGLASQPTPRECAAQGDRSGADAPARGAPGPPAGPGRARGSPPRAPP
ncbi:unnamed protein product, partial [Prorocentrum cordatum]